MLVPDGQVRAGKEMRVAILRRSGREGVIPATE